MQAKGVQAMSFSQQWYPIQEDFLHIKCLIYVFCLMEYIWRRQQFLLMYWVKMTLGKLF